jgi:hypothetical protein
VLETRTEKFVAVVIFAFIAFAIGMMVMAMRQSEAFDTQCIAKGGSPFHSRDSKAICLNPNALIK